jgi:hypothetical protein
MNNADIVTSQDVIEQSANNEQMDLFEGIVEALETEDLVALNDYLNAGVAADSDWRDYWDAFARLSTMYWGAILRSSSVVITFELC